MITIRIATPADAPALAAIYKPYVETTDITFEYAAPSDAEFAARIAHTLERYPYLIAEEGGIALATLMQAHSKAALPMIGQLKLPCM